MLCPSENLSSKLGYFQSAPPSPLLGLCIHRKAINKDKHLSCGVLPSRQSIECVYILAHLLRRCTRLLMVLPSRQQSDSAASCPVRIVLEDCHIIRKGRFIPVYRLGEDGDLL